jgi:hypothetical protein
MKDSAQRSGRSPDWLKMENSSAFAVKREAEEEWGKKEMENNELGPPRAGIVELDRPIDIDSSRSSGRARETC